MRGRPPLSVPSKEDLADKTLAEICLEYHVAEFTARKWKAHHNLPRCTPREVRTIGDLKKQLASLRYWSSWAPAFAVLTDPQLGRALGVSKQRINEIRQTYGWACINKWKPTRGDIVRRAK